MLKNRRSRYSTGFFLPIAIITPNMRINLLPQFSIKTGTTKIPHPNYLRLSKNIIRLSDNHNPDETYGIN